MSDLLSDDVLARLQDLHPRVIDLHLGRLEALLEDMGHPEKRLPPVIHVAGTNGKGSTIAFMKAILEAAGYSVHVYTSPHLVDFAERITLNGKFISEAKLTDLLLRIEDYCKGREITFFEVTTAAAFLAYSETPADILLLETGLGGRLDATNVIEAPAVTVITPISRDHEDFLGNSIAKIAVEKAGILKADCPAVIGPQDDKALEVIEKRASGLNTPLHSCKENWDFSVTAGSWTYKGGPLSGENAFPALAGSHQIANAATALAALELLPGSFTISRHAVAAGLQSVSWPARLQKLTRGPLISQLPNGVTLWLDGGHNEAAAERIAEYFEHLAAENEQPLFLVSGMLNTKDQISYFRKLQPFVEKAYAIPIDGEKAATPPEELARMGQQAGIDMAPACTPEEAIDCLMPYLGKRPCNLLIAGSLYLAGKILKSNG
ncbi:MAG: bifunctional folylpolyglutamate synthase/dihydrofolate synthase [Sneathiellales bacterium]|nr:bifunctional folylpolyglutamate synthase/dihydrofolate synthase [Sneathiellales bacterium]